MIHKNRNYRIADVPDLATMAQMLYRNSWCICNGIRASNLTLVNDSFSEDGAQEFVVIRDGQEIESLTVSWFESEASLLETLTELDGPDAFSKYGARNYGARNLQTHQDGACSMCA
mgnify:CR=1 FL=1